MNKRPLYLRTRLRADYERVLPYSVRRIQFDYALVAGLTMALIIWMLFH